MMQLIARWFEPTIASQDYRRSDYIMLAFILLAGVVARFWGLDNVGLHGDEETMAMPTMALLETGQPVLPSGMYYSRALLNIYMMAGSVLFFGESEWAFRFPSAVVGSLTGLAAFFLGRRFLGPHSNLAFVAAITLLPGMIAVSQTARMYVFFVTCIIWFGASIFRWERDQRLTSLIVALIVWLLALHFHRIAIFTLPLFLFPGLIRQSWMQLWQGAAAGAVGWLTFDIYGQWISDKYPNYYERPIIHEEAGAASSYDVLVSGVEWLVPLTLACIVVMTLLLLYRFVRTSNWSSAVPILLTCAGLVAMALLHYHLAAILMLFGALFWVRTKNSPCIWLILPFLFAALLVISHLGILYETELYPGRKLIGAVVGVPSVWPVLRFLTFSPIAGLIYVPLLIYLLVKFSKGQRLPDHVLFFAIAVWAPLLLIGVFKSYIPPRYAFGQLGFYLLCTFGAIAHVMAKTQFRQGIVHKSKLVTIVLLITVVAVLNPVKFAQAVRPNYDTYADHKGAAEYIQSLDLKPDTILIAEDMLQQTYYLGRVDYWLSEIDLAAYYSVWRDGRVVDQYTATPVIGTGDELLAVLESAQQHDVYILGSGENFVEGERIYRGRGIGEVLDSPRLEVVYSGRDGKTKVWKLRR